MVKMKEYREVIRNLASSYHPSPAGSFCAMCHFPLGDGEGLMIRFGFADCGVYGVTHLCMTCITRAMTTEIPYAPTQKKKTRRVWLLNLIVGIIQRMILRQGGESKKWRPLS